MFKFFDNIILLGAIQGLIVGSILLFTKSANKLANRLLGIIILLIASACMNLYLHDSGLYDRYQTVLLLVEILPFVMVMPLGPLIYFYTRATLDPAFQLTRKEKVHFAPIIIDLIPHIIVWIFLVGLIIGIFKSQTGPGLGDIIDEINAYSDIPRWLSVSIYVGMALGRLKNKLNLNPKFEEQPVYRWVKLFLNVFVAFQVLWFVFLVPYIIPQIRYSLLDAIGWYPIYVPMVIIIYWLGLKGYLQSLHARTKRNNAGIIISPEMVEKTASILTKSMEEDKYYLDPTLSVVSLSRLISLPQKTISVVLNQHLNKSFNDFVNEYRVSEVKKRLLESSNSHLTITGIALESGFNSQATFQRAFKQLTHVSPSEFLARHAAADSYSAKIPA